LDYVFHAAPESPTFGDLADSLKYELANLRVGCRAPEFKATDVDGGSFRLGEHRGKLILLMFSFKGCGPCEAMYPTMRQIRERFSPADLSVLGVMADESVDTVRSAVTAGDITWRCVWDGPSGPIGKAYQVRGYPTLLLIDRDGRIASRSLQRDNLIEAIEATIK
jgi:peroxiredoxin